MMLFEVFAPKGALDEARRRQLGRALITGVLSGEGARDDVVARLRAQSHVAFHEPETWTVGALPTEPNDAPRYVVRVSLPAGHLKDAMRSELVRRVTKALAAFDGAPDRLYREPAAWVHIVEVADGNMGAFGRVMRLDDALKLVLEPGAAAEYATAG